MAAFCGPKLSTGRQRSLGDFEGNVAAIGFFSHFERKMRPKVLQAQGERNFLRAEWLSTTGGAFPRKVTALLGAERRRNKRGCACGQVDLGQPKGFNWWFLCIFKTSNMVNPLVGAGTFSDVSGVTNFLILSFMRLSGFSRSFSG